MKPASWNILWMNSQETRSPEVPYNWLEQWYPLVMKILILSQWTQLVESNISWEVGCFIFWAAVYCFYTRGQSCLFVVSFWLAIFLAVYLYHIIVHTTVFEFGQDPFTRQVLYRNYIVLCLKVCKRLEISFLYKNIVIHDDVEENQVWNRALSYPIWDLQAGKPLMSTLHVCLSNQFWIHLMVVSAIPYFTSLQIKMLWRTLLNALLK